MRCFILSLGIAVSGHALNARAAKPITCTNPDTDEKLTVAPANVRGAPARLRKHLQKLEVHVLDLPEPVHDAWRKLPLALAAQDWCAAALRTQEIEDALSVVRVHDEFVSDKFSRLERWVRGAEWPAEKRTSAERLLATAGAKISDGDSADANRLLNQVIHILFGLKGLGDLPKELPQLSQESEASGTTLLSSDDIEAGCPQLAKRGRGSEDDLKDTLKRLRKLMNQKKLRVIDLEHGPGLVADLHSYQQLKANWPAIRVACAILGQMQNLAIDLGFVMARFHVVNRLSREKPRDAATETTFKELVRAASDAIAAGDHPTAHQKLEDLLVLLGEAKSPAEAL